MLTHKLQAQKGPTSEIADDNPVSRRKGLDFQLTSLRTDYRSTSAEMPERGQLL
ncbi:hypothetical protein [Vibrio sp.]|uniref:hypothetical protein n=1 Tax=Vibrio sp. TaxID=678 RepID=UPI003AA95648